MTDQYEPVVRSRRRATGARSAVWSRAVELLADGQWHPYEKIVGQLAILIKPGPAFRRSEAMRLATARDEETRERRKTRNAHKPIDTDVAIRRGARAMVKDVLRYAPFEVDPTGVLDDPTTRRIRYVPPPPEPPASVEDFTPLQLMVAHMTAQGIDSLDISQKLGLRATSHRVNGARNFLNTLNMKTDTHTTSEMVAKLRKMGILPTPGPIAWDEFQVACVAIAWPINSSTILARKGKLPLMTVDRARRQLKNRYPEFRTWPEIVERVTEDLAIEPQGPRPLSMTPLAISLRAQRQREAEQRAQSRDEQH